VMNRGAKSPVHPAVTIMVALFQGDPTLKTTELSPRLGLSVSLLGRLFKRDMGVSMVDYRNDIKMERFFQLVEGKGWRDINLAEVSRAAGFGSYAQFHRLFRSRWAQAPREYLERRARSASV
jgi:AraC-like DNA-binding protein